MSIKKVVQRILFLFLVIWAASTITFFIPRLSPRNPIRERFLQLAASGGYTPVDLDKIVASFNSKFGLDRPLYEQYFTYVSGVLRLDFGYSLNKYPKKVIDLIGESLPWTIGLLLVTTVLSFVFGNLLGALAAWPRSPRWVKMVTTPFVLLMGVPPVIMGVFLLFFVAFRLKLFPLGNAYSTGMIPDWTSWTFIWDVIYHQILPGLALLLGTIGGWVLSMRGMGITIQGEDYVLFAEHKGLSSYTIFKDYFLRNAMLPQVTSLALALGTVVTSAVVVESLFGLPGLGNVLQQAIRSNDFLVIYGVVLFITIAVASLMVLVELFYPLLDPRIRHD